MPQTVAQLERDVAELKLRMMSAPFTVLITTLAPEPLKLLRDIPATVQPADGEFVATFFDAGISASGDTEQEAVSNLKDLIVQSFHILKAMPETKLGKLMRQQIAVLRTVVQEGD